MQRPTANDFDHASLEAMMERYRAELLRYQRATPPGKPTLAQNLETSERGRAIRTAAAEQKPAMPPKAESRLPVAQMAFENKKAAVQPATRWEKVLVETPPMLLPTLTPRIETSALIEEEAIVLPPQAQVQQEIPITSAPPSELPGPAALCPPQPVNIVSEQLSSENSMQTADAARQVPPPASATLPGPAALCPPQPVNIVLEQLPVNSMQAAGAVRQATPPASAALPGTAALWPPQTVYITPEQPPKSATQGGLMPQPPAETCKLAEVAALPAITSATGETAAGKAPSVLNSVPQVDMPSAQPGQMPVPIKNNRAVAPVKAEQPGCIAHTEFEKGTGAYGVFRPYERMGKYTLASFLQTPGEAVQTLVRFAADVSMGSADAIRCRRSFTVKFFCREGEYDLFGMHLPVSMGTTEKALTDCCAASRANPKTGLRTRAAFWEFLVTHPEALHATMWLYSDLGTIGSYRAIDGYGLPCLWVNARDERRAVRPRWLSRQRPQTLTRFEAEELAGSDPDAVARDLADSLLAGERPQYELSIQVIEPEQFATLPFDPFDPTAIWPAEQFKPQRIGLLTLERLPDDVAAELDCARFQPENIIPGIEHVPAPAQKSGDDFTQVQRYLRSLGEFSRHRLIDNLSEELLRLPPLLLEQVLILFSRADLEFGQAMTLALGG